MTRSLQRSFSTVFLYAVAACIIIASPAFADPGEDVTRILELNSKLKPGMHLDLLNELLGPPAGMHQMGGTQKAVRYSWLHGEMGIEIYCVQDTAYRITITLPFGNGKDMPRAMDALTRQGQSKYGGMPRFDHTSGEYYWIRDGIRFGFSKYNSNTVRSTCTQAP